MEQLRILQPQLKASTPQKLGIDIQDLLEAERFYMRKYFISARLKPKKEDDFSMYAQFLQIHKYNPENEAENIVPPTRGIDDLWHSHILSTREYQKFCNEVIGHFVHHVPDDDGQDPQVMTEMRAQRKKNTWNLVTALEYPKPGVYVPLPSYPLFFFLCLNHLVATVPPLIRHDV